MMKEKLWVCFKRRKYNFMRPKLKSKRRCGFNLWKSLSDVCPDCNHCIAEHSHTFWIEGRYQEYRMDCLLCGIGEDSCPIDSGTQRRPAYRSWWNYQLHILGDWMLNFAQLSWFMLIKIQERMKDGLLYILIFLPCLSARIEISFPN